jgi:hypothetical protein
MDPDAMTVNPTFPTKQDVVRALMTMRAGRSRAEGNRAIRRILRQFGANDINVLAPAHYPAVIAAVTIPTAEDAQSFYGTVTDVQPAPVPITPNRNNIPSSRPSRTRSPLTLALEAELAKMRAKTKRSVPNYVVNTGNASRVGDEPDDAPQPEYPAGERVR